MGKIGGIAVIIALTILYGWGCFLLGHNMGLTDGAKQCPSVSQKMRLYAITEYVDGIRCQYESPSKARGKKL